MRLLSIAILALAAACSPPAPAPAPTPPAASEATAAPAATVAALTIEGAGVRPPPGGVTTGAGYMTIRNAGEADRLVAASSAVTTSIELHTHREANGVMRMERVEAVDVPAGGTVTFAPGGLHLMLFGWTGSGAEAPITLRFEKAGEVIVPFAIQAPGATAPEGHAQH